MRRFSKWALLKIIMISSKHLEVQFLIHFRNFKIFINLIFRSNNSKKFLARMTVQTMRNSNMNIFTWIPYLTSKKLLSNSKIDGIIRDKKKEIFFPSHQIFSFGTRVNRNQMIITNSFNQNSMIEQRNNLVSQSDIITLKK